MRLAQMQAIAHDLGRPPGELAELAGGGGTWTSAVPRFVQEITKAKSKPGTLFTTERFNLLTFDTPTMMQEWHVYNLRIPVTYSVTNEAAEASEILTAGLVLRIGGDIVWSQSVEVTLIQEKAASNACVGNVLFNGDLINPLLLAHGKTFTVEFTVQVNKEIAKFALASNEVWNGEKFEEVSNGTFTYASRDLSGHRVL